MPQVNLLPLPLIASTRAASNAIPGRRLRRFPGLYRWLLPAALLALWQAATSQHWIAAQVLPSPYEVWLTLDYLATSGDLWLNTAASVQRVVAGFAIGSLIGLVLGGAMGLSPTLRAYLQPSFNALVQIPVLGWFPFALLIFGIGEPLKYALIAHAALVPVTLGTMQAFRQAPQPLIEVARVNGFGRRQIISAVVLPAAVPVLFSAFRLAFTKAWLSLVVVELIASSEGLGYLIVYGRQLFQLDLVMASVVVVGAIGWLIDRGFTLAEGRLLRHRLTPGARP
ncbi:ABC transporter permease [Shimwellia pseudoproteus]|uniref:ABC transporter permease n=1 Tax=Shimwellia pseudoproteus TaxID=570012 RepID=UPI0018EA55C6|nr:ABC transporter permease [Shimwellia pseudoproteus]MBJ3816085.1 ABC transporter permease [Shimwellia pseudoproteus]